LNYFAILREPKNHLIFIDSELGRHFYTFGEKSNSAAFYQLGEDPLFEGEKISALGERLVFLALGSTAQPRIVMDLTNTVTRQFDSELPKPNVQEMQLKFVGRGSGRVFSEPLTLTKVDGLDYLTVDMNRVSRRFPNVSTGLSFLYGRKIPNDSRKVTTFGRNISLVSNEEYEMLAAPSVVKNFPADLANRSLEYSGVYEDGWLSEQSFFALSPKSSSKFIVLKARIPLIESADFSTVITVQIDGKMAMQKTLKLDNFELKIPFVASTKRHRIDISFSAFQRLPNGDGRPISAKVEFIGFTTE
jgi:hypothetical protein